VGRLPDPCAAGTAVTTGAMVEEGEAQLAKTSSDMIEIAIHRLYISWFLSFGTRLDRSGKRVKHTCERVLGDYRAAQ
jgi:hypothetical protein